MADENYTKRAAIYCRISLDKKKGTDEEGEGVGRQERACRQMCAANNFEVVGVYTDNSISAHGTEKKAAKERAEYNRMIKDYREHRFEVIVAWKLDRLTRSVAGLEDMIKELASQDLCICTTDLGGGELYLNQSTSVMIAQITASVAQFESSRKSERQKAAYRDRAQRGIMRCGKRSFGYDAQNNIIEEEAEIVRAIYRAYANGSSMNAITRALRGEDDGTLPNFPTSDPVSVIDAKARGEVPPDKKWGMHATTTILRNPKYAGYMYHAPIGEDGKHQPYDSNWKEWIVRGEDGEPVCGTNFEPIVDKDLWWKVQGLRDENLTDWRGRVIPRKGGRKSIGSGLYICGVCGKPLKTGGRANSRKVIRDDEGNVKRILEGHDYGMTYYCKGHMSRMAHHVDKFVLAAVRARLAMPDLKDVLYAPEDHSGRLAEIRREIADIHGRITQTENDYDEDLIDGRTLNRKLRKLGAKLNELDAERVALQPNTSAAKVINAPDPAEAFDSLTDPRQMAQVIDLLCTVTVYPHERGHRVTPESLAETVIIEWK